MVLSDDLERWNGRWGRKETPEGRDIYIVVTDSKIQYNTVKQLSSD